MRICECGRKEYAFWVNDDGKFRCYYCTFKKKNKKVVKKIRKENENKN